MDSTAPAPSPAPTLAAILSRIFWMILGPFLLLNFGYVIATQGGGWLTLTDGFFLACVLGLIAARYVEFQSGAGRTSTGEPLTAEKLRRYLLGVVAVCGVAWLIVNVIGNHVVG